MGKKLKQLNYKQAYKIIKPYVDLNIDLRKKLTKSQKWQISFYFNKLRAYNAIDINGEPQRTTFYKPKSKKKLKKLKKKFNVKSKRFKIIPIPEQVTDGGKIKINKNNDIVILNKYTRKILIPINNDELLKEFKNDNLFNYLKKKIGNKKIKNNNGFYSLKIKIWQNGKAKDIGGLEILIKDYLNSKIGKYKWVKENIDGIYVTYYRNQKNPKKKDLKNAKKGKKNISGRLRNRPIRSR